MLSSSHGESEQDRPTDFTEAVYRRLADDHLFFGIFRRPASSSFTSVQRLSVALCLLLTWMLANLMFYGRGNAGVQIETLGYVFSVTEIVIGVQSALIAFLPPLVIVQFFK